jgi:hypothetical protein
MIFWKKISSEKIANKLKNWLLKYFFYFKSNFKSNFNFNFKFNFEIFNLKLWHIFFKKSYLCLSSDYTYKFFWPMTDRTPVFHLNTETPSANDLQIKQFTTVGATTPNVLISCECTLDRCCYQPLTPPPKMYSVSFENWFELGQKIFAMAIRTLTGLIICIQLTNGK